MVRKKTPEQNTTARVDPFEDPTSIGNVLMKLGKITEVQLIKAVGERAQFDEMLLGALLKKLGFITDMDLARAMKVQAALRQGDPLNAELDVLDSKIEETECGARELSSRIHAVKQQRRDRGEKSGIFLLPQLAVSRTS